MISMLGIELVTRLPNTAALPFSQSKPTELESIEFAAGKPRIPGNKLVRVGCATTNERLRRWCIKNKTVTIPLNAIMVEITLGGSNAPICHGAGRRNMTLSDLVRKIEYVDANGESRYVDNPDQLRAASGCFGLMGVVTHITMEFPPMTYAQLAPKKMPVIQAVPRRQDWPKRISLLHCSRIGITCLSQRNASARPSSSGELQTTTTLSGSGSLTLTSLGSTLGTTPQTLKACRLFLTPRTSSFPSFKLSP